MNRFIARFYSNMIEGLHALFILAVVLIAVHFWNAESNYPSFMIGFLVVLAVVVWVVIFGFITTVVVMADTLNEIRSQNEVMALFLKKIAASAEEQTAPVALIRTRSDEPFIGSPEGR